MKAKNYEFLPKTAQTSIFSILSPQICKNVNMTKEQELQLLKMQLE